MVYTGPERREFIRAQLFITVKYSVADTQEECFESQSEDISSGGMKILLKGELSPGTLLKLQFELLKEEKTIRFDTLQARVVWVLPNNNLEYPYKAGLEFVNIDINERLRISNCIYHRAELLKKPFR
jgi:c-di-GMP-binding flagellar brake protein YcgR